MTILVILNLWDHDDNEVDHCDEANSAHPENTDRHKSTEKVWPEIEIHKT